MFMAPSVVLTLMALQSILLAVLPRGSPLLPLPQLSAPLLIWTVSTVVDASLAATLPPPLDSA